MAELGRAVSAACHLAAGEAFEPFTAALREGCLCSAQAPGMEARGRQTGGVQFFTRSTLGCHLASSLLFRILGQVRSVQAFVGDLSVGARVSVYCALFKAAFLAVRSELGRAGSAQFGGRSEAATEMEPGGGWFLSGGQMIKASCTGLPPCL